MRNAIPLVTALLMASFSTLVPAQQGTSRSPGHWFNRDYSQFIFYSVLEGCYADGVSNAVIDAIIPPHATGNSNDGFNRNFVYNCPLCHPAYEAMKLYRSREPFIGQKVPDPSKERDTFGGGLSSEFEERLLSPDPRIQRPALQELIQRWVAERVERLRLTDEERVALAKGMEEGRDKGAKALEALKALAAEQGITLPSTTWMDCAVCEGSFGACSTKPGAINVPAAQP